MSSTVDESDVDNNLVQELYDLLEELPPILQTKLILCLNAKLRCVFESHRAYIMFHDETSEMFTEFMDAHVNYEDPLSNEQKKNITTFVKALKPPNKHAKVSTLQDMSVQADTEPTDSEPESPDTTDKSCSLPSMDDYFVVAQSDSSHSEDYFVLIRRIEGYVDKCKSVKATKILNAQIETHLAYARTDQYGDNFDKCDTMVRPTASVRLTSEGHCGCNERNYKSVVHAGCIECCAFFPSDTRVCKCHANEKAFDGSDELGGCFPRGGCMHPGDWNTEDIGFSKDVFSICLICGTFGNCEHAPIHKDALQITRNYFYTSTDEDALEEILKDIMLNDEDWHETEKLSQKTKGSVLSESGVREDKT
jgi:hypothetical protein